MSLGSQCDIVPAVTVDGGIARAEHETIRITLRSPQVVVSVVLLTVQARSDTVFVCKVHQAVGLIVGHHLIPCRRIASLVSKAEFLWYDLIDNINEHLAVEVTFLKLVKHRTVEGCDFVVILRNLSLCTYNKTITPQCHIRGSNSNNTITGSIGRLFFPIRHISH